MMPPCPARIDTETKKHKRDSGGNSFTRGGGLRKLRTARDTMDQTKQDPEASNYGKRKLPIHS